MGAGLSSVTTTTIPVCQDMQMSPSCAELVANPAVINIGGATVGQPSKKTWMADESLAIDTSNSITNLYQIIHKLICIIG